MRIISHRGNLSGSDPDKENAPSYIDAALAAGFDVELDVWCIDSKYYLGHDTPVHPVNKKFLTHNRLWCHAKNLAALERMRGDALHCFWHQTDAYTLTSNGFIWAYPGQPVANFTVLVDDGSPLPVGEIYGICTDYPLKYLKR